MGSLLEVERALKTALFAIVTEAEVKLENVPFDPGALQEFYAFHFLPTPAEPLTLGPNGKDIVDGVAQIDLNVRTGKGRGSYDAFEVLFKSAFTARTPLVYGSTQVTIISAGPVAGRVSQDHPEFFYYPFSLTWTAQI